MIDKETNWAGNYQYQGEVQYPRTVEDVQGLVRRSNKVRALGTRHSFNDIADTRGELISTMYLDGVVGLDPERRTVTVGGGIKYGTLCQYLGREGFALHNLASLPHISVAGACATATHGSGVRHGNLATAVAAMDIVTAGGDVVTFSREQDRAQFQGAVVGLGGLGVVTQITLDVVPSFDMRQDVYENLPWAQLEEHLDDIISSAYSVSLFTDWRGETINQVWVKSRVTGGEAPPAQPEWFGATLASGQRHPIPGMPVENCTQQCGIPGRWDERMPHFRMEFTPSSGEELQTEYLMPREHGLAALNAVAALREQVARLVQVTEVRTIAADDLWMSPSYRQDSIAIHFTWKQDWEAVRKLLPAIEERLAPFGARPHWGKLFMMEPDHVRSLYERLPDFQQLLQTYDPQGKFRNAFLDTYIFGAR